MKCKSALIPILATLLVFPAWAGEADYSTARARLVQDLRNYARLDRPAGRQGLSEDVLRVMGKVKRHEFVPEQLREQAYDNHPLPIGYGQTISQPYIVALMTDLLDLEPADVVLEIGTGSGYQAAVLAELAGRVYTIEIVEPLFRQVTERLSRLGYSKASTKLGDGYFGWEEHAPFDAIIVTAAASHVPPPLIAQLKPGGRMVIPVGGSFLTQYLLLIEKTTGGEVVTRQITPVRFVPLTGEH